MPVILVGYAEYEDYRVTELPLEALEQLSSQYPLAVAENSSPEYEQLIITIAVHAELNRRKAGGMQQAHVPSRRELAELMVKQGFQQASKRHHPDGNGHHDAQVRLADVRDTLLAVSSLLRLGPLRSLQLAHLDSDSLPHSAGEC